MRTVLFTLAFASFWFAIGCATERPEPAKSIDKPKAKQEAAKPAKREETEAKRLLAEYEAEVARKNKSREETSVPFSEVKTFVLYEGMSRQTAEKNALVKRSATVKTKMLSGHPFYADSLELSAADVAAIKKILPAVLNFQEDGEKWRWRGDIQFDYALEWQDRGNVYKLLISIGTVRGEIEMAGPDLIVHGIMSKEGSEAITKFLSGRQRHRPHN
jgi:hypothetical protein